LNVVRKIQNAGVKISGLCHITGGGLGNVPRVLPNSCNVEWNWEIYNWPKIYRTIQTTAGVSDSEMLRVFNCGMGMLVIVPEFDDNGESSETVLRNLFGANIVRVGTVVQK
jgi:phosphoribosylformylglycinamidine cyclo-ligase